MSAFDQLESYLRGLERRLRVMAFTRGAAMAAVAALVATVLLVMIINGFAFSERSLIVARVALFLSLAFAIGFGLVMPLLKLNQRRAARRAEQSFPEFEQRLLTFAERKASDDPFLELLAADTVEVARNAQPQGVVPSMRIGAFVAAAVLGVVTLVWLTKSGPGYMGYGASLLWAGSSKDIQPFYDVTVTPGNQRVRRRTDQLVTARLLGFQAQVVRLFARYKGTAKWEQAPMRAQSAGSGYEFVFAGLPETVDYYVEAGGVKSKTYTLTAVDLPSVKKVRVTYHYPTWAGMQDVSEEGSGDLRAVTGTEAEVAFLMDRPLSAGLLQLDDQSEIKLKAGEGNWVTARVPIQKDGMYHVAAVDQGEQVRLTEDFFIEAKPETAPIVKIVRPRGDVRANPIEEVSLEVEAEDDFGLQAVDLHYSVNGGDEKTVSMLPQKGARTASGHAMIALEDYSLVPGDVVSLYATAKDSRVTSRTDIMFIEAEPFEREYSQAQAMGGGGGGGDMQEGGKISQRQKEIIAATWNQIRDAKQGAAAAGENARFLSDMQAKLRDQAKSLSNRMKSRELAGANNEFKSFSQDMDKAVEAMNGAVDKLKGQSWKDSLPPEQKALQHLLRAEATFRQIQVAFGQQGGGGGGGGQGRDLANLFDLELDTEKNQYETGQNGGGSAEQRQKDIDEAMQKLEQLARRQKELAEQQRNQQKQTPQQRWQQEMLRREAEELKKQLEQMAQGNSSQQSNQQSQQGQQGQQGQQSGQQSGQQGQQSQQQASSRQQQQRGSQNSGQTDPRIQRTLERLQQAAEDMRKAGAQESQNGQGEAGARRAAERLQEAMDFMKNMQRQQAGSQVDDLARRAEDLSRQQKDFANRLKQTYDKGQPDGQPRMMPGESMQQGEQFAKEKEKLMAELSRLEKDMQQAVRDLASSNKDASSKVREALGDLQQKETQMRSKLQADWLRRGLGSAVWQREQPITMSMEQLRDDLARARDMVDRGAQGNDLERALQQVEKLRGQMQQLAQRGQRGDQKGQQKGGQQNGQDGQQNGQQSGQQQGGQQAGQQQGGQQGGQQQGGQQGGQQAGGQQPGGQRGGNQSGPVGGGSQYGGPNNGAYGAINPGDRRLPDGSVRPLGPGDMERVYREGIRDLNQIRQSLADNPDTAKEVQDLIREMSRLDPSRFSDPVLMERIRSAVLPNIEQLEIQLRRQLEDKQGGQVRIGASDQIPAGYADAVAEYFRRLSKGK